MIPRTSSENVNSIRRKYKKDVILKRSEVSKAKDFLSIVENLLDESAAVLASKHEITINQYTVM